MRRTIAKILRLLFGIRISERCTCRIGAYYPRFGSTNAGWIAHANECPVYTSRITV